MRWQNPWAWLGLLTLALPILVHLFSRRKARIEPFPSLRFFDVSRLLPTRSPRLSDIPLLILRLIICGAAVAALAQPLWGNGHRARSDASSMARVIVLDTGALPFDSTRRALLEREAARSDSGSTTSLRLATDAPASALAGAVAWLRTQPMQREIVVLSTFPVESLDSLDVAGIPRDIGVSLRRLPKAAPDTARDMTARSAPPTLGTVSWASNAADDVAGAVRSTVRSAVLSAVRGLGAVALSDAPALGAGRAVVVVSPGADSAPSWMASARAISEPWMGDVLYAVRNDTTLGSASRSLEMLTDSTIMPPFVVLRRAANGAPVVMGAAIPGVGDRTRVLLLSRASAEHLATAALLLAAARAMTPNGGVTFADVAALPDDLLQRWQRAPSARPVGAQTSGVIPDPGSADTGPSNGRYLWLLVLVLLGVEAMMRRRVRNDGAVSTLGDSA